MRLRNGIFLFFLAAGAIPGFAAIATLGPSAQNYVLTGIGANSSLEGQSKVSWGTCAFDGTKTNCTLSGSFTGFDGGGIYSFVLSYPGNGAFPLIAVSQSPGNDLIVYQAQSQYSLVITLTTNTGGTISFYSFANFSFFFAPGFACTGVATCSVGQVGLTPNATISGTVTGSFDPTPVIVPGGAVTATAYGAFTAAAPSTWIEIYGINLATTLSRTWAAADFNGIQAPTALGGTTATIAGQNAFVYYVSPGQVDVQVPSNIPAGPQPLVLTTAGGSSAAYILQINTLEPGFLAPTAFIINGSQYIGAQFAGTSTFVLPVSVQGIVTARAKAGDNLTLYGIGFGTVSPSLPAGQIVQQLNAINSGLQISFAGVPATVTYAGLAPGYVGLYQFNVVVPNVAASDTVPITFTLGGTPGPQKLVISIK
jgi:uncharacterized protein (TIGR03437 family)